jgi:hypothetical protein
MRTLTQPLKSNRLAASVSSVSGRRIAYIRLMPREAMGFVDDFMYFNLHAWARERWSRSVTGVELTPQSATNRGPV